MDTERYKYYRETQLWPLADVLNFEQWIENFAEGEEQDIAKRILDFFIYIPDRLINQMLATVIGKCGYYFKKERGIWSNDDFKNNCWYSFIPGEELKPTDSGYVFNRKLRDIIHIPENRIVRYSEIKTELAKTTNQNVILVDDFVGSGHQTYVAWLRKKNVTDKSLYELTVSNNHKVIYAPLIVNEVGYNKIITYCLNLGLVYVHLLNNHYSLFDKDCPCWEGNMDLYNKAVKLIENKSSALGIPHTGGKNVIDYKGYREQGLAIAFEHGMPDACPPIFYWETADWKPLIKKVYSRP